MCRWFDSSYHHRMNPLSVILMRDFCFLALVLRSGLIELARDTRNESDGQGKLYSIDFELSAGE